MSELTLRNESTPEGRKIWAAVDKAASKVPQAVKDKMNRLTHDQIDAMGADEFAEAVATRVMGWKPIDRKAMGWGDGPLVYDTGNEESPSRQGFSPATDANDDVMVHGTASKWLDDLESEDRYNAYYEWLAKILTSRDPYYRDCQIEDHLYYLDGYQIGDYARAALHATVEEPPHA